MEKSDIEELQSSFSTVFAHKGELAEQFYRHLFAKMPEVEAWFGDDFPKQKEMFAAMLTSCLKGMVSNQDLHEVGDKLTRVHSEFNLGPREMELAAQALMAALRDVLGKDLSPQQNAAWKRAADRVMGIMMGQNIVDEVKSCVRE